MMIGVIVAFLAATSERVFEIALWPNTAMFILILIIVTNELTMSIWRIERDKELEAVNNAHDDHER